MSSWSTLARHVQAKLRLQKFIVNDRELIHLTALAIMIEKCIDATKTHDHVVFQKTFQIKLRDTIRTESNAHNLFECDDTKEKDTKEEIKSDIKGCELCDALDNHIQTLRFTRARFDVYEGCYQYLHLRTLLYDMTLIYVLLRDASRKQIDIYLFLQTTYALIRLHHRQTILLAKHTKNRYFVLWLMYFVHYFTDSRIIFKDWHAYIPFKSIERLQQLWISLCSLLFVRRHLIPSQDLYLCHSIETWETFVDQINQTTEIVVLRKSFGHVPLLFNLNIRPFFDTELI